MSNVCHFRYHMTPLIYAARAGHAQVVDYFCQNGAEINKQDNRGWTVSLEFDD